MGGGKGGGGTTYTERPLTKEEKDLLKKQGQALDAGMDIAWNADARSQQMYNDWMRSYRSIETGMFSPGATRENGYTSVGRGYGSGGGGYGYRQRSVDYSSEIENINKQIAELRKKQRNTSYTSNRSPTAIGRGYSFSFNRHTRGKGKVATDNKDYDLEIQKLQDKKLELMLKSYGGQRRGSGQGGGYGGQQQVYIADPSINLREAVIQANEKLGTKDDNVYNRQLSNMFAGIDSGFKKSEFDLSSTLARRGLARSGTALQTYKDLALQKSLAMANANNQAYNTAVQAGDAYRQQRVANLTGYAQLGRGMSGSAQNYLGMASSAYGNNAQIAGNTALGLGGLNNSYNSARWNAQAQQSAGKGAMTGAGFGAIGNVGSAYVKAK